MQCSGAMKVSSLELHARHAELHKMIQVPLTCPQAKKRKISGAIKVSSLKLHARHADLPTMMQLPLTCPEARKCKVLEP